MTRVEHTDVGAYALGLLNQQDRLAFEAHLAGCPMCRTELASLAEVAVSLGNIDRDVVEPDLSYGAPLGGDLPGLGYDPGPGRDNTVQLGDRIRRRARQDRMRRRSRTLLGAAAAVVIAAGGAGAGVALGGSGGGKAGTPPAAAANQTAAWLMSNGEKRSGTDASSGLQGTVALVQVTWGTRVAMELKSVKGPISCQLIAIDDVGAERVVSGWSVGPKGYGFPDSPQPSLVLQGGIETNLTDIKRFEVRSDAGQRLLTIRV